MKPNFTLRSFLLGCSSLLAASSIHAADVTWDITPGTIGVGDSTVTGGTGTWNTTAAITPNGNWTIDGGVNNVAWVDANNDTAIFGGTAGTVTIDTGGVTVGGLQFDNFTYTVEGDLLTFGAAGDINTNIASNRSAIISANLASTTGVSKTGDGILVIRGTGNAITGDTAIAGGTLQIGEHTASTFGVTTTYAGNISIASGTKLLMKSTTSQTLSGVISGDGVFQTAGNGRITLSGNNTYTGQTRIEPITSGNPSVSVSSINSVVGGTASSSLGAPTTVANGTIQLGGGSQRSATLVYTGPGETTDRIISIVTNGNGAGKTIESAGGGLLKFTSPIVKAANNVNTNDFQLTGDSDGELTGGIPAMREFTKAGAGTWVVPGPSIYNGKTNLSGGTLSVASPISNGGVTFTSSMSTVSGSPVLTVPDTSELAVGMTAIQSRNLRDGAIILSIDSATTFTVDSNADGSSTNQTGWVGFAGSLGLSPSAASNLDFVQNSTLRYTGPDCTTDRGFDTSNRIATFDVTESTTTLTFTGDTTGAGGRITKTGPGAMALGGALAHTGSPNNVDEGTLLINGDASAMTGAVEVAGSATFGGTGTIGGALTVADTGILTFDLSTAPGSHDKLDVTGAVTLPTGPEASVLTITSSGGTPSTGTYTLISAVGGISGDVPATVNLPGGWTADAPQIVSNDLVINITSTGGGPSDPFDTWAALGTGVTFDGDANGDGVQDGLAFLLGVADPDDDANGSLPAATETAGGLVLSFNCLPTTARGTAELRVEHSSDLGIGDPWLATVDQVPDADDLTADNGVTFTVVAGPVGPPATNTVTATIAATEASGGKLFGRLVATKP